MCRSDIDYLADAIDRVRLECDMVNPSILQTSDDLSSLLSAWDTNCHTEAFYRDAFLTQL